MTVRILVGDVRARLADLPDESVHCVVTSPPYFGLRDYGTAAWEGGDAACDHSFKPDAGSNSQREGRAYQPGHVHRKCRCGARRIDSQIGLEETPAAFVAVMVDVFREVRRVLRSDGTCWINLGDAFQNKQLLGIPWKVAFALQDDGWILRQDIIWAKPNPMPESVTDRCTKAHEYLFLLSKSARYHFDQEPIREPISDNWSADNAPTVNELGAHVLREGQRKQRRLNYDEPKGANRRSVWTVATQPFSEAHFATFPPALIEPCIMAGCPKDCCAKCGAPVVRQTERVDTGRKQKMADGWDTGDGGHGTIHRNGRERGERDVPVLASVTTGWSPSCACDAGTVRGTVLDCFGGAGTSGLVADRLGRDAILIELNPEYAAMARRRIEGDAGMFASVAAS